MRTYSEYLPFLKRSKVVGLRKSVIPKDRILMINHPEDLEEVHREFGTLLDRISFPFYHEVNLDMYIPICNTMIDYLSLAINVYLNEGDITSNILDIDYSDVARNIKLEEILSTDGTSTGSWSATLNVAYGDIEMQVTTDSMIVLASNRALWTPEEVEGIQTESVSIKSLGKLLEAFTLNPDINTSNYSNDVGIDAQDAYEEYVYNYIKSAGTLSKNRVPLLIGTTAVAKSALVKDIVKKLDTGRADGYRLIDFRAAFIDKNDIEGFATKVKDANNEYYAEMSPMRELIEATDEYLEYARATLDALDQKISLMADQKDMMDYEVASAKYKGSQKGSQERDDAAASMKSILDKYPDDLKSLLELKRLYTEKAKTPVLFFDEITRAPKDARNAFTTILNQKAFMNYNMKKARILAATNYPVGMPEDYIMVYTTEEINDIAALERFEPFIVTPKQVYPRWEKWAESHLCEPVLSFIKQNPDRSYDLNTVVDKIDSSDGELDPFNAAEIPFPNFRTWEFVSDYLKGLKERNEPYDAFMVNSLIGENQVSADFHEYIRKSCSNYVKYQDPASAPADRDRFSETLRSGVLSGVPVLLSGPTSYGKTTRVQNLADELNFELIPINLATKDATQIKGIPTPVPVQDTVVYGSNIDITTLPQDIQTLLADTKTYGVSGNTTDFMPDKYIRDKLVEAKKSGKGVILFFDEVNRCDKSVLSSVFEAVSDNRYMGVQFEPGTVKVVCAANLGGQYGDITQLDPAFSARFAMVRKDAYDESDVRSFKKYIQSNDKEGTPRYSKVVSDFLVKQSDEDLLGALKSVDDRTLLRAVPSMRAWDDISTMINNIESDNPFGGRVLFETPTPIGETINRFIAGTSSIQELVSSLPNMPDNWVGFLSSTKVTLNEIGTYTPLELREGAIQLCNAIESSQYKDQQVENMNSQLKTILISFKDIEIKLLQNRRTLIEAKLGTDFDIVDRFFNYYNTVSGDKIISLKDLRDISMIRPFIERRISGKDPDSILAECSNVVKEFIDCFGDGLSEKHYQEVLNVSHDVLRFPDTMLEWWSAEIKSPSFITLVTDATKTDVQYNYTVLQRLGVPVASYKKTIDDYYKQP